MANPTSKVDFKTSLATFLAESIGDGTWADVINEVKVDEVGKEVAATAIKNAWGQLIANFLDDFVQAVWALHEDHSAGTLNTNGATSATYNLIDTLADGEGVHYRLHVQAHGSAANEIATFQVYGSFFRNGASIIRSQYAMTPYRSNLGSGVTVDVDDDAYAIVVTCTGEAAKDIDWSITPYAIKRFKHT